MNGNISVVSNGASTFSGKFLNQGTLSISAQNNVIIDGMSTVLNCVRKLMSLLGIYEQSSNGTLFAYNLSPVNGNRTLLSVTGEAFIAGKFSIFSRLSAILLDILYSGKIFSISSLDFLGFLDFRDFFDF